MPGILHHPLKRRAFFKSAATAAAGAAVLANRVVLGDHHAAAPLHLALLSDTHIPADITNEYRGFKPVKNLETIIPGVLASKPEAVIINGDAARLTGELDDYRQLQKMLQPVSEMAPVYIGLGNHDHRANFFSVIEGLPGKKQSVDDKHVVAMEHPAVRILILDSLLYVNKVAGLLGQSQREWLSSYLAGEDDRPVVLFIHHTLGDGDGDLLDVDRLFRLIQPSAKVKAIFYGHSHEYRYRVRDEVHLINLPAVGYNFSDAEPVGWVDSHFHPEGVDLTLRAFGGNLADNGKTTKLRWH